MTGKVLNSGSAGFLVTIIPLAIATVVFFTAWPIILSLLVLIIVWKIWDNYQWLQRCEEINPYFQALIHEHQGCLTPIDLSLRANLSGKSAQRFLEKKAEEFGAQRKEYQERGTVYYFLTASALGSIFDDSEPVDEEYFTEIPAVAVPSTPTISQVTSFVKPQENPVEIESPIPSLEEKIEPPIPSLEEKNESPIPSLEEKIESPIPSLEEKNESPIPSLEEKIESQTASSSSLCLNQTQLAKRLDMASSTVGRNKDKPNFAQWSMARDPDGVGWKYIAENETFVPVD